MDTQHNIPKLAIIFGGTVDENRREAAQRFEKPRINEIEIESLFGAHLYDFEWFKRQADQEWRARLLYWAANKLGQWSMYLALLLFLTVKDADVVYATGEDVGLPLAVFLRLTGKKHPRIIMRLEQPIYGRTPLRRFISETIFCFALKRIDLTLCRTSAHVQMLKEIFKASTDKVILIPETIDFEFYNRPVDSFSSKLVDIASSPYILSAGLEMRDYLTLIEAVRDLPIQVVIGAGSPWSKFHFDEKSAPDLPKNVCVSSFTASQMRELYRSAAFVVVPIKPTLRSCGITVVLESWAMERAVIASRTVGLADYIQHNETGIFVEPNNVKDLRAKILYLLQQPEEAIRLGKKGNKRVATELNLENYIRMVTAAISKIHRTSV